MAVPHSISPDTGIPHGAPQSTAVPHGISQNTPNTALVGFLGFHPDHPVQHCDDFQLSLHNTATSGESQRRHVASACDGCRRRKLKCSGVQPCSRCVAGSLSCTFGYTPARWAQVDYVRHLERKVAQLEARLSELSNHEDPSMPQEPDRLPPREDSVGTLVGRGGDNHLYHVNDKSTGTGIFHGKCAGLGVLRIVRDKCDELAGIDQPPNAGRELAHAFDLPTLPQATGRSKKIFGSMPPLEQAQRLSLIAMDEAMSCHECIDRHEYNTRLEGLYNKDPENYDAEDEGFLTLLLAVLAVGRRCDNDTVDESCSAHCDAIKPKGLSYYRASVDMLDLDEPPTLDFVRTVIYQTFFLLSASMVSNAYARTSTGVAAALRMGLHISSSSLGREQGFADELLFRRRQVFAVLFAMHGYLASILGVPMLLRDTDPEQIIPVREADLSDKGRSFVKNNPHSPEAETIIATKVFAILAKLTVNRHSLDQGLDQNGRRQSYDVAHKDMVAFESALEEWSECLPPISNGPCDPRALLAQLTIRYAHAVTRIALYRPFLHYLSVERDDPRFSVHGYTYGSSCIFAAMQAVWVTGKLKDLGLLQEACWFHTYSLSMAASCLMFFYLANKEAPTAKESAAAAYKAHDLLGGLAEKNLTARRCYDSINALMISIRSGPENISLDQGA